jgi:hypothetical protein
MLEFEIANLYRPDPDATNFVDGEVVTVPGTQENGKVTIPLCNQQEAEVQISMWDPDAIYAMQPYQYRLRAWLKTSYGNFLVHDGIITEPVLDTDTETITIPSVDHSHRAQHHFIRLGDLAYDVELPLVGPSLALIMEAAQNLTDTSAGPSQADRYPPLGIDASIAGLDLNETWMANPSPGIKFERGEQVWEAFLQMVGIQTAPEFMLIPIDGVPGVYQALYTTTRCGLHDPVNDIWVPDQTEAEYYLNQAATGVLTDVPIMNGLFVSGWGEDNCFIRYRPGGRIVSHVHVLADGRGDADEDRRITTADTGTAVQYGVYVDWEQTNFKSADDENLKNRGRQILAAYSVPPEFFDLKIKPHCTYGYLRDFLVGTVIEASWHVGVLRYNNVRGRIMEVRLFQDEKYDAKHRTELTVQPHYTQASVDEDA